MMTFHTMLHNLMGALCSDFWDGLNIWVVLYLNGLIIKSSRTFQQRATKTITFRKCQSPTSLKITVVIKTSHLPPLKIHFF